MNWVSQLAATTLATMLPPLCVRCGELALAPHGLCAACWGKLDFIADPRCTCCGVPFAFEVPGGENLCGACLMERPLYEKARAPLKYTRESRGLILPFKHSDRTDLAPALAKLMIQEAREFLNDSDLIIPVPLHHFRLFTRRYNQAALLAKEISRLTKIPVALMLLQRHRKTPSQGQLTRAQRLTNLQGAFSVAKNKTALLKNKKILLIDDVMTTGATANACTRVLLKAGAKTVRVLTLAHVAREHD